jgi:hypothetical protein
MILQIHKSIGIVDSRWDSMITAGFKICYYRTLRCIKCILEAFPFNWAAGKGKKTK